MSVTVRVCLPGLTVRDVAVPCPVPSMRAVMVPLPDPVTDSVVVEEQWTDRAAVCVAVRGAGGLGGGGAWRVMVWVGCGRLVMVRTGSGPGSSWVMVWVGCGVAGRVRVGACVVGGGVDRVAGAGAAEVGLGVGVPLDGDDDVVGVGVTDAVTVMVGGVGCGRVGDPVLAATPMPMHRAVIMAAIPPRRVHCVSLG